MKIIPTRNFREVNGKKKKVYDKGKQVDIDEETAKQYIRRGWAEPVENKSTQKAVSK